MELLLPSAGGGKAAESSDVARIIIYNDSSMRFGQRLVDERDLNRTLEAIFSSNPERKIVVFADDKVSMQKLVSVIDMVNIAGGKSLYVRPLERQTAERRP
jgi:biopolymer transport protein ExbD